MYYIYRITNLVNGKTYIGQHRPKENEPFDKYLGSGELIRRAIKKYGKESFKKEILYNNIQYKKTADSVEKFAIAKEKADGKAEYNISTGGTGGDLGPEVRRKIAKVLKGRSLPEETKKKMSYARKGKKHSEEWKMHISEAKKGIKLDPQSEETKRKKSEALKGREGKKHSEETRKKLSESHKGKTSPMKGKHYSEEIRKKMSEAKKGMHWHLDENGKRVYTKRRNRCL